MRAPISVTIAGGALAEALASLAEGLEAGLIRDVQVSPADPQEAALAMEAGASLAATPQAAMAQASGRYHLHLAAGVSLCAGWAQTALKALAQGQCCTLPATGGAARLVAR